MTSSVLIRPWRPGLCAARFKPLLATFEAPDGELMRERMTGALRSALDHAQAVARELNQDFVGTEHLLLGLLSTPEAEIQQSLQSLKITPAELVEALRRQLPKADDEPVVVGQLPLSPKAQRAINFALAQAQTLHVPTVSTRLLMLALIQDAQPSFLQSAMATQVDVAALKAELHKQPAQPEA